MDFGALLDDDSDQARQMRDRVSKCISEYMLNSSSVDSRM